ncbi:cell division protein DivIB [Acholeplasma sp. CAG:878]|nr:cell division protein DivIB [Acholeplasma sp. CAG:878]
MKKRVKKRRRLKIGRILLAFFLLFLTIFVIYSILNLKITNIFISGNYYLSDQQIIDAASIGDYPSVIKGVKQIKNLKDNIYIKDVRVKVRKITQVYIEVTENRPLFYSIDMEKTVLLDGRTTSEKYPTPTLLNYVIDSVYPTFVEEIGKLDIDILNRISEIKYEPNDVDDNRFLLLMTDGNYVYINNSTFYKLSKYMEIIRNFPNKKGILYLDYGNNFEIIE